MPYLVRTSLFFTILALPLLTRAQFSRQYVAGSYMLSSDDTKHVPGQLRLKSHRKLIVITPTGKKLRLKPTQVINFQLGTHSYVVAHDFVVLNSSRAITVEAAFAERIDSGRITLLRYTHLWNSGSNWLFLYRYPLSFYLITNLDGELVPVHNYVENELFQQAVRPSLQLRPDLLQLLNGGRITYENFPAAIHALNDNLPLKLFRK